MISFLYFLFIIQLCVCTSANEDQGIDHLIDLMRPSTDVMVKEFSNKINESWQKVKIQVHNRINKRAINAYMEKYVNETFAQPMLTTFKPSLKLVVEDGIRAFDEKKLLLGTGASPDQLRELAEHEAKSIIHNSKRKLKSHLGQRFWHWIHKHKRDAASTANGLSKRQENDNEIMTKANALIRDGLFGNSQTPIYGILAMILFQVVLTMGAFISTTSILFGLLAMAWATFFVQPLISRMLLGYWFYEDDSSALPF